MGVVVSLSVDSNFSYAGPFILVITINGDFYIPRFDVRKVISFWRCRCSAAIALYTVV